MISAVPAGLDPFHFLNPALKRPGYFRLSLRDEASAGADRCAKSSG